MWDLDDLDRDLPVLRVKLFNPFRALKPLLILNPRNFVPKTDCEL